LRIIGHRRHFHFGIGPGFEVTTNWLVYQAKQISPNRF
jgi:hypothetical protein